MRAYDTRTMAEHRFQPRIRHVIMVLEGQCPLCQGHLGTAVREWADPQGAEPRLVGRCDTCWLDFIGSMEVEEAGRRWELYVCERAAPAGAYRPTDAS